MAEANVHVEVSIEASLHKTLTECLQDIESKYGIRINHMHVEWRDVSRVDCAAHQVAGLTLETSTGEESCALRLKS